MKKSVLYVLAVALVVAVLGWPASRSRAESPAEPQGAAPAPTPALEPRRDARPGVYVGISGCSNAACHGAAAAQEGRSILGNEYQTRLLDPHYRAYEILDSELSAKIAGALEPGVEARDLGLCLDCHSVHVPDRLNDGLYVEDGISCEGCHGPAGGWGSRHFEDGWTRRQSLAAGMNDLRDLERRAEICLSCHLGTGDRAVDHRLIAAGHPRLPFELDNYSEDPGLRHWKYYHERDDQEGRRPTHGIRAWAVGQAAAFRHSLLLLAGKAEGDGPWPEFSELACTSCHHSLADGAWRERRGYRFRGGLPPWNPARFAVLRHLLAVAGGDEAASLEEQVDELARRIGSLTGRQEVARRARALASDLEPYLGKLERMRWSRDQTRGFIRRLAADHPRLADADVAAAEQVAWSLQSLASHLARLDRRLARPLNAAIDALFDEVERAAEFDGVRFAERLEELGQVVR